MAYRSKYIPKFPYLGEQVTIGSGRLMFHAKDDSAFIFASKAISLATSGSVHVNASEGVFVNGSTIELGLNAQEAVIKGNMAVNELRMLYSGLQTFVNAVGGMSATEIELSVVDVTKAATVLSKTLDDLRSRLPNILSETTKTL
jgi:hypothetical protein